MLYSFYSAVTKAANTPEFKLLYIFDFTYYLTSVFDKWIAFLNMYCNSFVFLFHLLKLILDQFANQQIFEVLKYHLVRLQLINKLVTWLELETIFLVTIRRKKCMIFQST